MNHAPCRRVSRLVSESFERRLSRFERLQVWSHLPICGACRVYRRHLRLLRRLLRAMPLPGDGAAPSGPPLSAEARQRIDRALRAVSASQ